LHAENPKLDASRIGARFRARLFGRPSAEFHRIVLRWKQLQLNRYHHQTTIFEARHLGKLVVRLLPALNGGASGAALV
jgi:hypothetical protein